jgi:LCCL domain
VCALRGLTLHYGNRKAVSIYCSSVYSLSCSTKLQSLAVRVTDSATMLTHYYAYMNLSITLTPQDTGDGTTLKLRCPAACGASLALSFNLFGGGTAAGTGYTDDSAVCQAAVHAGTVTDAAGGLITVTVQRATAAPVPGSAANGVTSVAASAQHARLFTVSGYNQVSTAILCALLCI